MTREEAVARIKDHIEIHRYHEQNAVKIFEALDMAIKALEQPEIIHCQECKHKPSGDEVNHDITFPDWRCPCQCEDYWYSWIPNDNWYCGNAERREDG